MRIKSTREAWPWLVGLAVVSVLLCMAVVAYAQEPAGQPGRSPSHQARAKALREARPAGVLAAGGPDAYGYVFEDSNEPGGPTYAWEEISGTGTELTTGGDLDDGWLGPVSIGFDFPFYGNTYTQLYVGSNGYVSFGAGYDDIPWRVTLPHTDAPNNDVMPLGGDKYILGGVTHVYTQTLSDPTRLVVQFVDLDECCTTGLRSTFEVILYPDGTILTQYQTVRGSMWAAGIENDDGTVGLYYGDAVQDGLAVRYYVPAAAVFLSPGAATKAGKAGATVVYSETLYNLTGADDSFDLTVSSSAWTTTLPITNSGVIADGDAFTFAIQVDVPPGAPPGASDVATVEVTSLSSPTVYSDTTALTTIASSGQYGYVFNPANQQIDVVDTLLHVDTGTAVDTNPYGLWPWRGALSPGGEWLYASLRDTGQVLVIDATTHTPVMSLTVGSRPHGIAFSTDGTYAFVANRGADSVSVIDTGGPVVTTTIPVGAAPYSVASSPCLDEVYVTNKGADTVSVIDVGTLTVTGVITGFAGPWDVVVSPYGHRAYVSNHDGGSIGVIDTASDSLIATWAVGSIGGAGLDISPDGRTLYVADNLDNATYTVDAFTGQVVAAFPTGTANEWEKQNWELEAFPAPAGPFVYVSSPYGHDVEVVNVQTGSVVAALPLGGEPRGLALFPPEMACLHDVLLIPPAAARGGWGGATVVHTGTLYNLTGAGDSFDLLASGATWTTTLSHPNSGVISDGGTFSFTVQVEIPPHLASGALDVATVTATSLNSPGLYSDTATLATNVFRPGYVFNAAAGEINVVDTVSHRDVGLTIDTSPHGLWPWRGALSPDGKWLYASLNGMPGTPVTGTVLVVSTTTNTPVVSLTVGRRPHGIAFSTDGAYAFVANQGDPQPPGGQDTVSVIDTTVPTVTRTITVGDRPISLASSPCLDKVYVTNYYSHTVSVIDVGTLSVTKVIAGLSYPWDVVVSSFGDRAYVSNKGASSRPGPGSIGVIDTASDSLIDTWVIPGARWISGLDLSPDGSTLYVADANAGDTFVLDTSSGQVVATIPTDSVGDISWEVEVFPAWAGPFAYVSNPLGSVAAVNVATNSVAASIPLGGEPRSEPHGLALFPPPTTCGQFAPTAVFTPTMSVIQLGGTVNFVNLSTGSPVPTYEWDFGDGSPLSYAQHPAHTYEVTGTFTVLLTATNPLGWSATQGVVRVEGICTIYLPLVMRDYP